MWPSQTSACDAVQRIVLLPKVRDLVHVRRADQPSVEIVGPRVVGALDAAGELRRRARCRVACRDAGRRCRRRGRARQATRVMMMLSPSSSRTTNWPGRSTCFGSPGADPHPAEQSASISRSEVIRVDVVRGGQRPRSLGHHVAWLDDDVGVGPSRSAVMIQPRACLPSTAPPTPALKRELGRWDLTAIGVNQVIGGAVFALPAALAASVGAWSPWMVAAVGLASMLIALVVRRSREPVRRHRRALSLHPRRVRPVCRVRSRLDDVVHPRRRAGPPVINVLVASLGFYWPSVAPGVTRRAVSDRASSW